MISGEGVLIVFIPSGKSVTIASPWGRVLWIFPVLALQFFKT